MNKQILKNYSDSAKITTTTILLGVLFSFAAYLAIISFVEILNNIAELVSAYLQNQDELTNISSKARFAINLIWFVFISQFSLYSFFMFSSGLSLMFYRPLAEKNGFEEINLMKSTLKALKWQTYRYIKTFLPITIFSLLSLGVLLIGIIFFNPTMTIVGLNAGLVSFVFSFVSLNLMFLLAIAVLLVIYFLITMFYGTEIAVSEPGMENEAISRRSYRIINLQPATIALFATYGLFGIILTVEILRVNIFDLRIFLLLLSFNLPAYAGIKYLKVQNYIGSLLGYYEKAKSFS